MIDILMGVCMVLIVILQIILIREIRLNKSAMIAAARPPKQIKNTEYDELEIIKHLDYLVDEAIDQYVLYNITPMETSYINSNLEHMMLETLQNDIPDRLSSVLLEKLSYIYNENYLGKFLGNYIFMKVTEYVVVFNNGPK